MRKNKIKSQINANPKMLLSTEAAENNNNNKTQKT
jgi:hypothetical protein